MAMDYPVPVLPRSSLLRDGLLLAIILAVGLLDQSTKFLVQRFMQFGESIPADGFVRLTYVVNPGAAFGLFQGQSLFLTVGSFLGIGVLVLFYYRAPFPGPLLRLSLGLQLGGAVGNLLDRLRLGEVVDFVDVGPWPIFNVADSAIVVGIGLLMALVLFTDLWGVRRVPISPLLPDPSDGVPPRVGC